METNLNITATLPSDADFRSAIIPGKFVRLEYLTDLNEYIKTDVLIKQLTWADGAEWLELATGETIPLDRVVYVSGKLSPRYPGYESYSCDC
ncbi:hypothetical protein IC229_18060 [Spirosoma sp. BT702]|uniref:Uncharacterized protein n=1 Tax=Spirosoma profusum TaxID=2771354 RepID=A0A926Y2J3_9BACT|nr:hypothetical protein [Spirosoma profusum]MBD2702558.1 hypothetical protein [Spirosoma profusum]